MNQKSIATIFALLAAVLYAINIPLSKMLLKNVDPSMMAAFLYLGAGSGMMLYQAIRKRIGRNIKKDPLTKKDLPYTLGMVILDIIAPILLMVGIGKTNSANVALLNNFEIVATSMIALILFGEIISRRLWIAIVLVSLASVLLSVEGKGAFTWNEGSLFVLGACLCWGMENNCTKMISHKSSEEIVMIKGIFSGLGSFFVAIILGERIPSFSRILLVLGLGFVAYGLSIHFYIMAQKDLGAAKTSVYYAVAPFLGVAFSMLILGERPELKFYFALGVMGISTILMIKDTIALQHTHYHTHFYYGVHRHGNIEHSHPHIYEHSHLHIHRGDEEDHEHQHAHEFEIRHDHSEENI